jgi:hypothetical protein
VILVKWQALVGELFIMGKVFNICAFSNAEKNTKYCEMPTKNKARVDGKVLGLEHLGKNLADFADAVYCEIGSEDLLWHKRAFLVGRDITHHFHSRLTLPTKEILKGNILMRLGHLSEARESR